MFEHDHSAARGEMATRRLIVFRHNCALGNAPAHTLFDRVKTWRVLGGEHLPIGGEGDNRPPARSFADYAITVDLTDLPAGVEVIER
jgi:CRISPR-associated protein Csd2